MTFRDDFLLYHYWSSTSSWRVRWGLKIKQIDCEMVHVNLATGESHTEIHRKRNPIGQVPVLEFKNQKLRYLTESVAILEWLDETVPGNSLLPSDPRLRATARQLAEIINANTHPLQNPSVTGKHSADPAEQSAWNHYWVENGLKAYEATVSQTAGKFSIGDAVSYPDLFLIPICRNALRFKVNLEQFPLISRIYSEARKTEACKLSEPEAYEPK